MFCRPTLLLSRLIFALWLLLFGAVTVLLRRSWTCAEGRVVWEAGFVLLLRCTEVCVLRLAGALWRVCPEGVAILVCGVLLAELVVEDPEEPVRRGADELLLFELLVWALCSFFVVEPEVFPVRRFWPCTSNGVVHIIAMQSISTTLVILFIILFCLRLVLL
jgi:hypothetical protein